MDNVPNKKSPTRRLTILYICALSTVALLAILGQIVLIALVTALTSRLTVRHTLKALE